MTSRIVESIVGCSLGAVLLASPALADHHQKSTTGAGAEKSPAGAVGQSQGATAQGTTATQGQKGPAGAPGTPVSPGSKDRPAGAAAAGAAGNPANMDPKAMMEAMEKAGAPAAEHETLKKLTGTWTAKVTSWMDPSQPPVESTAKVKAKPVLGGRFIEEEFEGKWMNKPFKGMGLMGYDKTQKKYVSTWADSMATSLMVAYGTADATGKVITSTAEMVEPMTGEKIPVKLIRRIESDSKNVFEFYRKGPDGKEFKEMEIVYSKR